MRFNKLIKRNILTLGAIALGCISLFPANISAEESKTVDVPHYGVLADWDSLPSVYEFSYDNSDASWYWGMWRDGVSYTSPEGEFNIDVRNEVSLYSDGEYVYLDVIFATCKPEFMASVLEFRIDGQLTQFQLLKDGLGLEKYADAEAGVYEFDVNHDLGDNAGESVESAISYAYIKESGYNYEFEVKIPLTAFAEQNPDIDLENINEISFFCSNITHNYVSTTGISTFPFVLGGICLLGVGFVVYKRKSFAKNQKKAEENNE